MLLSVQRVDAGLPHSHDHHTRRVLRGAGARPQVGGAGGRSGAAPIAACFFLPRRQPQWDPSCWTVGGQTHRSTNGLNRWVWVDKRTEGSAPLGGQTHRGIRRSQGFAGGGIPHTTARLLQRDGCSSPIEDSIALDEDECNWTRGTRLDRSLNAISIYSQKRTATASTAVLKSPTRALSDLVSVRSFQHDTFSQKNTNFSTTIFR